MRPGVMVGRDRAAWRMHGGNAANEKAMPGSARPSLPTTVRFCEAARFVDSLGEADRVLLCQFGDRAVVSNNTEPAPTSTKRDDNRIGTGGVR